MIEFAGGVYPLLDAISYVLESEPYASRLTADSHGWVETERLISAA